MRLPLAGLARLLPATLLGWALLLGGCQSSGLSAKVTTYRGGAMGTSYTIRVVIPGERSPVLVDRSTVEASIHSTLRDFDLLFSTYEPASEISRFNRHRKTVPLPVSAEFGALVQRALELAKKTDGAFDPTVGPLVRLYGFGPAAENPSSPPTDAAIAEVRRRTGWQRLHLGAGKLSKTVPSLELDLNAIAKGAGVDAVAEALDQLGCRSYMVEIGGEVRCRGRKPNGKSWRIGVANPGGAKLAETVDLLDRSMATSGTYLQFKNLGQQRVHHILDPRTGRNAGNSVVSVTVIARTCALADGLATALMVMGPDEGDRVLRQFGDPDLRALLLLAGNDGIERRALGW